MTNLVDKGVEFVTSSGFFFFCAHKEIASFGILACFQNSVVATWFTPFL